MRPRVSEWSNLQRGRLDTVVGFEGEGLYRKAKRRGAGDRYTVHETVSPYITPCPSTAAVAQITTVVVDRDTDDGRGGGKSLAIAELGLMQGHLIKDVLWQEGSDCPGAVTDCVSSFRQINT